MFFLIKIHVLTDILTTVASRCYFYPDLCWHLVMCWTQGVTLPSFERIGVESGGIVNKVSQESAGVTSGSAEARASVFSDCCNLMIAINLMTIHILLILWMLT
jgi:hypothetical protein